MIVDNGQRNEEQPKQQDLISTVDESVDIATISYPNRDLSDIHLGYLDIEFNSSIIFPTRLFRDISTAHVAWLIQSYVCQNRTGGVRFS
jgi:hypothetical protein